MATHMVAAAKKTFRELQGVVVSAGLMSKTVKVRVGGLKWNARVQKHFKAPDTHLVHDPNNSLRLGDIVAITPGWRTSQHKRHVVKHIIAPAGGIPISERPPVPTEEERFAEALAWRAAKDARRNARKEEDRQANLQARVERKVDKLEAKLVEYGTSKEEIAAQTSELRKVEEAKVAEKERLRKEKAAIPKPEEDVD